MPDSFTHTLPIPSFDRELTLSELLQGIDVEKMGEAIKGLLGPETFLQDLEGNTICGQKVNGSGKFVTIKNEIEPVAVLYAESDEEMIASAASLLEILIRNSARYIMASDLHLEAIQSDYESLQQKHEELVQSETRYKELAENLEFRVREQVDAIESAHRKLYQAEKMASVGQLAAGVAHEINNPMGFINSNLQTAGQYVGDIKTIGKMVADGRSIEEIVTAWQKQNMDYVLDDFSLLLNECVEGAARVSRIVRDLKDFTNIDRGEVQMSNVNEIISNTLNVARTSFSSSINISQKMSELPSIRCNPGYLGQAFLNILLNASQAVAQDGDIIIRAYAREESIHVEITDDGDGIPEDVMPRVFEPFFTTREVGNGTGLGLSVSRDIIDTHGGEITIDSEPGKGTTVNISLPIK